MAQDLFTALQLFRQGAQDFAQSRLLSDANKQVALIRNSDTEDEIKNQQLRDLGDTLTASLLGAGAPMSTAQVGQLFKPKEKMFQSIDQALLSDDPNVRARGLEAFEQKAALNQEQAALQEQRVRERSAIKFERKEAQERKDRTIDLTSDIKVEARDAVDARNARKSLSTGLSAVKKINRLEDLQAQFKQNPTDKVLQRKAIAEIKSLRNQLIGANRVALTGGGPLSEADQALLDEVVADPSNLTDFFGAETAKLRSLKESVALQIENDLRSVGGDRESINKFLEVEGFRKPEAGAEINRIPTTTPGKLNTIKGITFD